MATYCIGDLHGRYDLFIEMLDKIKFNHENDKLYLLGDVINKSKGSVDILRYIMKHRDSCFLILGNHENFFLNPTYSTGHPNYFDKIFCDIEFKEILFKAMEKYSKKCLYKDLCDVLYSNDVNGYFKFKRSDILQSLKKVEEWLECGKRNHRENIFNIVMDILEYLEWDFLNSDILIVCFFVLINLVLKNF